MLLYSVLVFLVTVILNIQMVNLLQITNFYVPRRAINQVEIDCKYDLEGQKLYDVKWYKDGQQFYRCTGDGSVYVFPVDGIMIRHSHFATIGSCPLTLIVLTPQSAGEYKCEVTLDHPGFPMDWRSSRLDFLPPPKKTDDITVDLQGSEKHTSEEEPEIKSGCGYTTNNLGLLLLMMYFIFT